MTNRTEKTLKLTPSQLELRKQVGSNNSPEAKQDFQDFRHKLLAILTRFGQHETVETA